MELNPNLDIWSKELPCWERGQMDGRTRMLDTESLFKNLLTVKKVFDKYGLRFWLSHGTLLGVYRDNQFILHDDDADISMDFSQRELANEAVKELREQYGFYVPNADPTKPIGNENAPYYDLHMILEGSKTEAWFFEKKGNYWIYDEPRCKNDLKHPAKYYDTLGTIMFRGVEFNCPNHVEEYLTMMYGPSFMTPDKNKKYNNNPLGI
jgi:hypothetical protein